MTVDAAAPVRAEVPAPGENSFRRTLAPAWVGVMVTAVVALWLALVGWRTLEAERQLWYGIRQMAVDIVGPAMLAFLLVVVLCERAWPAVRQPLLCRAHLVDACYLAVAALVVVPTLPLVQAGLSVELTRHASFLILARLHLMPQLAITALILVGIDAMNWGAHLANHRIQSFWRLHALHHSQEDMSVLTTFRTHPLLHVTYSLSLLPALVLSASGKVPAASLIAYGCMTTLAHANLRWTFGPLGRILVSPAYHRLHHDKDPSLPGANNFGFVLVCWDQLARRAVFPDTSTLTVTGIAGRPVPVEQEEYRTMPRTVIEQLIQPFRRVSATDAPL
jgi:sterol desaturase/sphingolipid hydroxylase (fatty acid hydroxylase superfamily)